MIEFMMDIAMLMSNNRMALIYVINIQALVKEKIGIQ